MQQFSALCDNGVKIMVGSNIVRDGKKEATSLALFVPRKDGEKVYHNERDAIPEEIEAIRKEINDFLDRMIRRQSEGG